MLFKPADGIVAAGFLMLAAGVSMAAVTDRWQLTLIRGSTTLEQVSGHTQAAAWDNCVARIKVRSETAITGTVFACQTLRYYGTTVASPPPTCAPAPADRVLTCPAPTVGSWTQRATVGPAPECAIAWSPLTTPAGACVTPPPTCPPAPAPQTRQVICGPGYTGAYTEVSSSTVGPLPTCTVTTTWTPVPPGAAACVPQDQPPTSALFSDRFEYVVDRAGTSADLFRQHGYTGVKAENSTERSGSGYLHTRADATLGSRVLVLESRPTMKPAPVGFPYQQTDYYLQIGRETSGSVAIPANAWIQFLTYATPESRFSTRDKTIYPCRGNYPCHPTWLFMWGAQGFEETSGPAGARFLALEAEGADRDTRVNDGQERKLFQNANHTPLLAGRWYQVKLHMDISGAQGVYEAWVRERGATSWTKVADWRGGQTPNFTWPVTNRQPYNIVRIPTTVNAADNTVLIDDFKIAENEAALN